MDKGSIRPRFVVDGSGRKSAIVLSIGDYKKLLGAWEEVQDAKDFAQARGTAKGFLSTDELRLRVLKKR